MGLPEVKFDYDDPEVDHQWFELQKEGFEETAEKATVAITVDDLVVAFSKCSDKWMDVYSWDEGKPALDEMIRSAHDKVNSAVDLISTPEST